MKLKSEFLSRLMIGIAFIHKILCYYSAQLFVFEMIFQINSYTIALFFRSCFIFQIFIIADRNICKWDNSLEAITTFYDLNCLKILRKTKKSYYEAQLVFFSVILTPFRSKTANQQNSHENFLSRKKKNKIKLS